MTKQKQMTEKELDQVSGGLASSKTSEAKNSSNLARPRAGGGTKYRLARITTQQENDFDKQ
jgi:bacteriocin-like protein